MAAITISSPSGAQINPNPGFVPYNNNGTFGDSMLYMFDSSIIGTTVTEGSDENNGLRIDNLSGNYQFGDFNGIYHNSCIVINDLGNITNYALGDFKIELFDDGDIKIGSSTILTPTAYGNSGQHMRIYIGGTLYLIQLLKATP